MLRQVATDKLLEFAEHYADHIAEEWWEHIQKNKRVPSYHSLPEKKAVPPAVSFYKNLKRIYHSDDLYGTIEEYFTDYAAARHAEGISLHEAIYVLVMMRRHLWLSAEFQALFTSALDIYQSIESINRTVLITDYATYVIIREYKLLAG